MPYPITPGDSIGVYKSFERGQDLVQASWSSWVSHCRTRTAAVINGHLVVFDFLSAGGSLKVTPWFCDLTGQAINQAEGVVGYVDGTLTQALVGTYYNGVTTFELPEGFRVGPSGYQLRVVLTEDWTDPTLTTNHPSGTQFTCTQVSGTTFTIPGDFSGPLASPVYLGWFYKSYLKLSRLYAKNREGRPEIRGHTFPKRLAVSYQGTAGLSCSVTNQFGATSYKAKQSITLPAFGSGDPVDLPEGTWNFPISGRTDHTAVVLESTDAYPETILSMAWEGTARVPGGS